MTDFRPLVLLSIAACTMLALTACEPQSSEPATTTPSADAAVEDVAVEPAVDQTASPPRLPAPVITLRASGNEPFWSVKADGGTLTYTTPEMQPGMVMTAERSVYPDGIRFTGTDGDKPFELDIRDGQCQDSMSGKMFEYTSSFSYGERELTGCAGEISE